MVEEWSRWQPAPNIEGRYYFDVLNTTEETLIIHLNSVNNTQRIQLTFKDPALTYRYTNESWCFGIFGELSNKYDDDFYAKWSFFTITKSEYAHWALQQSKNNNAMTHFCIIGGDELIDILARHEPEITIIK